MAHLHVPGMTEGATIGPLEEMITVTVTATEAMTDTDLRDMSKSYGACPGLIESDGDVKPVAIGGETGIVHGLPGGGGTDTFPF
jgi:hypothetical protein